MQVMFNGCKISIIIIPKTKLYEFSMEARSPQERDHSLLHWLQPLTTTKAGDSSTGPAKHMQKFMLLTTTTPLNFEKLTLKNNVLKNCLPPLFQPQRQDFLAIAIAIVAASAALVKNFPQPRPQFKTLRKICQK